MLCRVFINPLYFGYKEALSPQTEAGQGFLRDK